MSEEKSNAYRLRDQLSEILNRNSRENASNTPDYILADFMLACLAAFETEVKRRDAWHGREEDVRPKIPVTDMPYKGIEGFIQELGATVRECLDCGCLTPGGPTRCKRCAKEAIVQETT